jgi:light-regulated signal transduction histidine kinase (bacteriophytochrome)
MPAVGKVKEGRAGIETSIDPVTKDVLVSAYRPVKWGWGMVMQRPEREAVQPVKKVVSGLLVFTVISMFVGLFIAYYAMQLLYSIRALALRVLEQERLERETNEKLQAELAERKLAEQRLELTLQELARSNKELEQFAYVASHDLQEPLRKVGSFTELLEKRYREKMGPDADRYIGYIVDGAKRMSQLISDLLTLSRIGSVPAKFAMTDCNVVLRRVLDDLQHRIRESNAEVSADQLPTILADESLMGLVFQNLISNALKFRGDRTPLIHVSARREGAAWVFAVSDNGIGIEPEYFDRIFLMFQRLHTKAEYPGTGIGLAICRKVIERHGGRIWLASEFGKGTTFYFTLPDGRKEVTKHDPDEER